MDWIVLRWVRIACVRVFLFDPPHVTDDTFVDNFGIEWLVVDGTPTPSRHPLEKATLAEIAKYPRPSWPTRIQIPEADVDDLIIVADAPCPGLLDMCFGLRNSWVCLDDMTSNWRSISALLDWSLETIVSAYKHLLSQLPRHPDILVYGDDLGFQQSMFVSEIEFRNFVRPRMRTIISRLRYLPKAAPCFHSCGAIRPIVGDLCDLGIDLFNFDGTARGMVCSEIRREIPRDVIIHGSSDLVALGRSVRSETMASVAILATEIADSMPTIAAPLDNISLADDVESARLGAEFLRQLTPDDVDDLARLGPIRSVLETAVASAKATIAPALSGKRPASIDLAGCASDEGVVTQFPLELLSAPRTEKNKTRRKA
uniref:Putative methyltransferase n=1 Tax=Hyphomicrobium sp. AT3 TaxID=717787 RepID=G0KZ32_9HYPH|nr:putative methyltransferase [Hyphomicrobium sp. AT3]